jgi:hypothetical protein
MNGGTWFFPDLSDGQLDRLLDLRKWAVRERDALVAFQKECSARRDLDGARFFRQECQGAMKFYRACCLILPWYASEPPGDCKVVAPSLWPEELTNELRRVFACIDLDRWPWTLDPSNN